MKFLVVIAALVAVAAAKPGLWGNTVVAGPSGTIVASPGLVARSSLLTPGVVSTGLLAPGLVAPGLINPGLVATRSLVAPGVVLASPAGTVVDGRTGTVLVGASNLGSGAVISNGLLGPQILV